MNEERAADLQAAIASLLWVAREARHAALPAWLGLDLSIGQLKSLQVLANRRALSVSGLARLTGCSRPMASLTVEQLVQRGLVTRTEDPVDRRRVLVRLSEAGCALLEQLDPGDRASLSRWCAQLGEGELRALVRGLRALSAAATGMAPAARSHPTDTPEPLPSPAGAHRDSTPVLLHAQR